MVKASWNSHRDEEYQESSSIRCIMDLGKNGSPSVASDDNNGGTCRLGNRSVVGLGVLGASKNSSDLWISLAGEDMAGEGHGCLIIDSVLLSKGEKDQGLRGGEA